MNSDDLQKIANEEIGGEEIFVKKIYTGLGLLEIQHRIMVAHLSASLVKAKAVLLSLAWIALIKTFVF